MDLATELHDLVLTMDRQAAEVLRPLGVNLRQHVALTIIGEHPGLTGRQLAGGLRVTGAAASGIVRGLVTDGLAEADAAPGSGNRQSLRLTPAGTELLGRTTGALGSSFDEVVRRSGHDPDRLAAALHDIHQQLVNDPKES
ncbi:MarR family transcriptional regulator [Enemella dayhoffiae]|uniref:MarR family transcriptional regulator n=1 Tax=Enemella dayhoffiae TaxID=2016507 RepID=A0A255H720_9ACTN|nr:MarR family transcriptional regulator [Enemella dayhoffiae]OYO23096.1 MarR family transcriptional regulator [Enemella dayhoffiae]